MKKFFRQIGRKINEIKTVKRIFLLDKFNIAPKKEAFWEALLGEYEKFAMYEGSKSFYNHNIEKNIGIIAEAIFNKNKLKPHFANNKNIKIAVWASEIHDKGGHTGCLMRFIEAFYQDYEIKLFINNMGRDSLAIATKRGSFLKDLIKIVEQDHTQKNLDKIVTLYKKTIEYSPNVIFTYLHMQDAVSVAVLALLKKYTNIKIIFMNLADHRFFLGSYHSHALVDIREKSKYITKKFRKNSINSISLPLQIQKNPAQNIISKNEIELLRKELGIQNDEILSLSGFCYTKIFKAPSLPYFKLIKKVLSSEPKLKHLFISNIDEDHLNSIKNIFNGNEELFKRIIFKKSTPDFEKYIQASDFFIDSFPFGSALAHIDVIKFGKPTVIKVNTENQIFSFEEYLYPNYEYACKTEDQMYKKIQLLVNDNEERKAVSEKVLKYYNNKYSYTKVKEQYNNIIQHLDNLEMFYEAQDADIEFNINPEKEMIRGV